jgi:hypothetical protein
MNGPGLITSWLQSRGETDRELGRPTFRIFPVSVARLDRATGNGAIMSQSHLDDIEDSMREAGSDRAEIDGQSRGITPGATIPETKMHQRHHRLRIACRLTARSAA